MNEDIWDVLHDGAIEHVEGTVPGEIVLRVGIAYLRRMFDEAEGGAFVIRLRDCTRFEFHKPGSGVIDELSLIAMEAPEILSVLSVEPLSVLCATGTLELAYGRIEIALDSGATVDRDQLVAAAARYWDDWAARKGV